MLALIVPAGTKRSPTAASVNSCQRVPRSSAAARTRSTAEPSIVRCVPRSGIVTIAERKVPTMLPTVESAYRRPATAPASFDVHEREPDREGRDRPEQRDRHGEERERREEGADDGADRHGVEPAQRRSRGSAGR